DCPAPQKKLPCKTPDLIAGAIGASEQMFGAKQQVLHEGRSETSGEIYQQLGNSDFAILLNINSAATAQLCGRLHLADQRDCRRRIHINLADFYPQLHTFSLPSPGRSSSVR